MTLRIAALKDCKVKNFIWKEKYFWRLEVWEVNSFSAWNAVLEHLIPPPPRTRWIASLAVIFDKGVRAKVLGGWRNRKICSLNVALTRFWTRVKGKDISQIWDETLVLIKWLNNVLFPLWSSRGSNWIFTKRAWNKSFWLTMIYFEWNV